MIMFERDGAQDDEEVQGMNHEYATDQRPLLTLCIPTNGVVEWVRAVLESIEQQSGEAGEQFEVVITDNGDDVDFEEFLRAYASKHSYVRYQKTMAQGFLNLCESFRMARGSFVKFVNHRMPLRKGALSYFIGFAKKHLQDVERPIVYFSNGSLGRSDVQTFGTFDAFVNALGIYSTWSGGIAFWSGDVQSWIGEHVFHPMFPNTDILFHERHRRQYIVDDTQLLDSVPVKDNQKGHYDLYWTFAVDFPTILFDLMLTHDIRPETFISVKKKLFWFLMDQYIMFNILHHPCSYDISNFEKSIRIYYSRKVFSLYLPLRFARRYTRKWFRLPRE